MQAQANALKQQIREMMAVRKQYIGSPNPVKLETKYLSSDSSRSNAGKSLNTADNTNTQSARSSNQAIEQVKEAVEPIQPSFKNSNQLELPKIEPFSSKHGRSHSAQLEEPTITINHSF